MSLRRIALFMGSLWMLTAPSFAHAEASTSWVFTGKQVPGQWQVKDLAAAPTDQGLRIQAQREGILWRSTDLDHPIDAVAITATSREDVDVNLVWQGTDQEKGIFTKFIFTIPKSDTPVTVNVTPTSLAEWNPHTDSLGFVVQAGSDITIQEIQMRHWNVFEKLMAAARSFWTFDEFRPYSINFLWGPLIAWNEPARQELFNRLPPMGRSGLWIFYYAIAAAALGGWAWTFFSRRSPDVIRKTLCLFAVVAVGSWLILDLRMGAEILSYAVTDIQTHVLPPSGQKYFRTHERFYDVMTHVMPTLRKYPRFAFVTDPRGPFYQNLRYMAYPSLPALPNERMTDVRLLFVYDRPDITIDGDAVLGSDGRPITSGGKVLADFGDGAFLYVAP